MPTQETESGTRITYPDSVDVTIYAGRGRGGMRATVTLPTSEGRSIAAELSAANANLIDAVTVRSPGAGTRGFRAVSGEPLLIEVPLAPNERAMLLVEADGVYSWRQPDPPEGSPGTRAVQRTARFTLAGPGAASGTRAATRNIVIDWLMDKVRDRITAYVFKFIVRSGVQAFVYAYEAAVLKEGPITVSGLDPARWSFDQSSFTMPAPAPKTVLLLIHGTFSTTRGSFGGLTSHAAGRALLSLAYKSYGAVLGFDHSTLAEDPAQNAVKIFKTIESFPDGTIFDTVAYSRGALVVRTLFEQIIAKAGRALILRRAVFVGCTNAGTHLAEPQNLEDAADLYTNVVVAGARAFSLIPGAAPASALVMTAMRTLGTLVHYLAETAITERSVPGLAAMQPESKTVEELNNGTDADRPAPERYAIVSSFKADLTSPGFTKALVLYVTDRVTDRIFKGQRNDLVVDSKSMSDLGQKHAIKEIGDYGETSQVYHTIYFAQERVALKIAQWLQLGSLPTDYRTGAIEIAADMPLSEALARLNKQRLDAPVVIRRTEHWGTYFYLRRVADFARAWTQIQAIPATSESLRVIEAFQLHEDDAALHRTPDKGRNVAGLTLAEDVSVASWDGAPSNDARGEVLIGSAGVIGVRLPRVQSMEISAFDTLELDSPAESRGANTTGFNLPGDPAISPHQPHPRRHRLCHFRPPGYRRLAATSAKRPRLRSGAILQRNYRHTQSWANPLN